MNKFIIIIVLYTIIGFASVIGLIWSLLDGQWLWSINFSILLINVLVLALTLSRQGGDA